MGLIAALLASPLVWYLMHEWLQGFAFQTEIHFYIFPVTGFITIAIAILSSSVHAIKAALANPVDALRYE